MEEFNLLFDWVMNAFIKLHNFFKVQHPIIQACVYMPLALLVLSLFISVVKFSRGGKE